MLNDVKLELCDEDLSLVVLIASYNYFLLYLRLKLLWDIGSFMKSTYFLRFKQLSFDNKDELREAELKVTGLELEKELIDLS